MTNICYLARVKSQRGNVIKEQIFDKKTEAMNFKTEIEYGSEKKVSLKKVKC